MASNSNGNQTKKINVVPLRLIKFLHIYKPFYKIIKIFPCINKNSNKLKRKNQILLNPKTHHKINNFPEICNKISKMLNKTRLDF